MCVTFPFFQTITKKRAATLVSFLYYVIQPFFRNAAQDLRHQLIAARPQVPQPERRDAMCVTVLLLGCRLRAEALGMSRDSKDEGGDDVSEKWLVPLIYIEFFGLVDVRKKVI